MEQADRPSHRRTQAGMFRSAIAALCLSAISALPSRSGAQSAGTWASFPFSGGYADHAPARYAQTSAYDAARRRLLVLGGLYGSVQELHVLDVGGGTGWSVSSVAGAPVPTTAWAAGAWDPFRSRLYLFGGYNGPIGNDSTASNEIRFVSAGASPAWNSMAPVGTPPSPRWGSAMIYDFFHDRLMIYGGRSPATGALGETWVIDSATPPTWSRLVTQGDDPGPREGASLVFDPPNGRFILYGGSRDGVALGDVYEMQLTITPATWTRITPEGTPPPPRAYHQAVVDSAGRAMIVCGGTGAPVGSDVWSLSLDGTPQWSHVEATGGPVLARQSFSAGFDNRSRRLVLHAGLDPTTGARLQDTPALALDSTAPVWLLGQDPAPTPRYGSEAIYDSLNDRYLVVGGQPTDPNDLTTAWELRLGPSPHWTMLAGGAPFVGAGVVVDPVRRRLIVIGGNNGGSNFWNCVSAAPLDAPFKLSSLMGICMSGTLPPERAWAAVAYDSRRDGVWMFGGSNTHGQLDDLWFLSLSPTPSWSRVVPAGAGPSARTGTRAVYDRVRDRLILDGGSSPLGPGNGYIWYVNLSGSPTWVAVASNAYPRDHHTFVLDPRRDRLVSYGGGLGFTLGTVEAALVYALPAWSFLTPLGGSVPVVRTLHASAYDSRRDRLLVFGGVDGQGHTLGDAWLLDWAELPTPTVVDLSSWSATSRAVRLEWRTSDPATSAWVYRRTPGAPWAAIGAPRESGRETLAYDDLSVVSGGDYEYGLSLNGGSPQATIEIRVPLASVRPQIAFESNPFGGQCRLRVTSSGAHARLELFDASGRLWWAGELPDAEVGTRSFTIPLPSEAPPGLYLVRMRQDRVTASARAFRLR